MQAMGGEDSSSQIPKRTDQELMEEGKAARRSASARRSRSAEFHNLSERRRRDRINEKLKALQELLPNCTKTDKVSMLDEAIDYLKTLQLQLQMLVIGKGMAPVVPPELQHYLQFMNMTEPPPPPPPFRMHREPGVESVDFLSQMQGFHRPESPQNFLRPPRLQPIITQAYEQKGGLDIGSGGGSGGGGWITGSITPPHSYME